jgi:hypothetical protein
MLEALYHFLGICGEPHFKVVDLFQYYGPVIETYNTFRTYVSNLILVPLKNLF